MITLFNDLSLGVHAFDELTIEPPRPILSVIVPTRNEAGNIDILLTRIKEAFGATLIEVIFVDDSTDNTPQVINAVKGHFSGMTIQLIHRSPNKRIGGLGGAVVEGLKAAQSDYACVMDGDLQHPPELIPVLLKQAHEKQVDMVIASRRCGDSEPEGLSIIRNLVSRGLDLLGRIFFTRQLLGVSDPLTGFFLVRRQALDLDTFNPNGFKILMEILVRHSNLKKAEIPFQFGERHSGQSKASLLEVWRYFTLLWTLRFGEGSLRFAGFALVGLSGILINLLILFGATDIFRIHYLVSAGIATIGSTLWNFVLTETWVYRISNKKQGLFRRLGLFFTMNLIALSLRTPILYILTTILGIHYMLSNLISLMVMTVSRFMLSDNLIWGGKLPKQGDNFFKNEMETNDANYVIL